MFDDDDDGGGGGDDDEKEEEEEEDRHRQQHRHRLHHLHGHRQHCPPNDLISVTNASIFILSSFSSL